MTTLQRVLLIDDDEMEFKLVETHLNFSEPGKYELDFADNIDAAIAFLENNKYRAIILDNRFHPYSDFRETVPLISTLVGDSKLYVISSTSDDPCFSEAAAYQVDEVIDKFDLPGRIKSGLFSN